MVHILVADDVEEIRFACERILCAEGHIVITATNGTEAASLMDDIDFDVVVTDLMMPDGDGIQLANHAHQKNHCPKLIAITGGGSRISSYDAVKMSEGFFDASLMKPVSKEELVSTIDTLLKQRN